MLPGARLDPLLNHRKGLVQSVIEVFVFPVDPMYLVALKVGADGSPNRRKEFFFAESGEKAKSLEYEGGEICGLAIAERR